jgi:hypothetical protein
MRKKNPSKPSEQELAILQVLWQRGDATVKEANAVLNEYRPTGYTTTLKLLQIMHEQATGDSHHRRGQGAVAHLLCGGERVADQQSLAGQLHSAGFSGVYFQTGAAGTGTRRCLSGGIAGNTKVS